MTVAGPCCHVPGIQGPSQLLCNSGGLGPGGSKPASHPVPRVAPVERVGATHLGEGQVQAGAQLRAWRAGKLESQHTDDHLAGVVVVTTRLSFALTREGCVVLALSTCRAPGQALYRPSCT